MKYREVKKLLLAASVVGAVVITGCKKEVAEKPAEAIEEAVEEESAVEEVVEEPEEDEEEVAETYTVKFEGTSLDDITATSKELVSIPQYQAPHYIETFEDQTYDDEFIDENFEVIEEREDGTLLVKPLALDMTQGLRAQYSYDEATESMRAIFVNSLVTYDGSSDGRNDDPQNLGLYFVLSQNENGEYFVSGIEDFGGNDVSDIEWFQGFCKGYSLTALASEADFSFEDEIYLSEDLTLYPVIENIIDPVKNPDTIIHTEAPYCLFWSYGGGLFELEFTEEKGDLDTLAALYRVPTLSIAWTVRDGGRLISDYDTKEYDVKTKKVVEYNSSSASAKDKGNGAGQGATQQQQEIVNYDTPSAEFLALEDLSGVSDAEAAAKVRAEGWSDIVW